MKKNGPLVLVTVFVALLVFVALMLSGSGDKANLIPAGPEREQGEFAKNSWQGILFVMDLKPADRNLSSFYAGEEETISFTNNGKEAFVRALPLAKKETLSDLFPPNLRSQLVPITLANKKGLLLKSKNRASFSFVDRSVFLEIVVSGSGARQFIVEILPRIEVIS